MLRNRKADYDEEEMPDYNCYGDDDKAISLLTCNISKCPQVFLVWEFAKIDVVWEEP